MGKSPFTLALILSSHIAPFASNLVEACATNTLSSSSAERYLVLSVTTGPEPFFSTCLYGDSMKP